MFIISRREVENRVPTNQMPGKHQRQFLGRFADKRSQISLWHPEYWRGKMDGRTYLINVSSTTKRAEVAAYISLEICMQDPRERGDGGGDGLQILFRDRASLQQQCNRTANSS
jgi:hypothetical protein